MSYKNEWGREIKLKYKYENKQNPVKKYKMSKKELEEYLKELEKRHSNKHQLNIRGGIMGSYYVDNIDKKHKYCVCCGIKLNNRYTKDKCLKCILKEGVLND